MSKIYNFYKEDNSGVSVDKTWYDSSNVIYTECIDNDGELKQLKVVFANGSQYLYKDVDVRDYLLLREASSQGSTLNRIIKKKGYEYERLDNANLENIREEYEKVKNGCDDSDTMTNVDKQYLNLLKDILEHGVEKETRAGKVKSLFGKQLRFDLKEGFPLLTTKKVFTKGIIHELLWFLSGSTNIKYLVDNDVHIWDDDAYRFYRELFLVGGDEKNCMTKEEFLDAVKEEKTYTFKTAKEGILKYYKAGDLGDVYGRQWRDFNRSGIDQIQNIIDTLKTNPNDRRMLCVAFNPSAIKESALPPCHVMFQFYTRDLGDGRKGLSCMYTMRSNDWFLGSPFNIASYALLTHIIAKLVNMVPDELIASIGDCHLYIEHLDAAKEQLSRKGSDKLPRLLIHGNQKSIEDFNFEDFEIVDYNPDPPIKAPLLVGM